MASEGAGRVYPSDTEEGLHSAQHLRSSPKSLGDLLCHHGYECSKHFVKLEEAVILMLMIFKGQKYDRSILAYPLPSVGVAQPKAFDASSCQKAI